MHAGEVHYTSTRHTHQLHAHEVHAHKTHPREICVHEMHELEQCREILDLFPVFQRIGNALDVIIGAKPSVKKCHPRLGYDNW
jgi:hypothetical protein